MTTKTMKKELEQIAKTALGIDTLTTRNSDELDFNELSVWQVKNALESAYKAGQSEAQTR